MKRIIRGRASRRQFVKGSIAVAAAAPLMPRMAAAQDRQVNVYNWDTYIGETTLDDFSAATGIDVRYDLFADNSELFARLREGNPGYDVIVPTNDYVERMVSAAMLQPLDHSQIPNMANIDPAFEDPSFDPGRQFTAPYFWGTIGFGYRKSATTQTPDSWAALFAPDTPHAGRISWLGEPSTVVQMALKYLGYSLNSTDMSALGEAEAVLTAAKPAVRSIAGDNGQDLLLSGEVDVAMEWNGDILQVMTEDDDLSFANPQEGGLLWEDSMAIAKDAPHLAEAHEYINFILDGEVHAAIAEFIYYALPNAAAKAFMPEAYMTNPAIFPPDDVLARFEYSRYLGEEINQFYNDAMTRIRAS